MTIIFLISIFFAAKAQKTKEDSIKMNWQTVKEMLLTFSKRVPEIGVSFTYVVDGKIYDQVRLGYANRIKKVKTNGSLIHQWGSVSKLVTSIAVFQLIEQGRVKPTDFITQYIPELKKTSKGFGGFDSVRVYHLINHSTGYDGGVILYKKFIKDHPEFKEKATFCFDDLKPYLHLFKFIRKPGTKYKYSNWGYSLLGLLVERVTGRRFSRYVKKKILKPLDMKTAYFGSTKTSETHKLVTSYYMPKDSSQKLKEKLPTHDQCFGEANGGLKASPSDMIKLMNFFMDKGSPREKKRHSKVLKKSTRRAYLTFSNKNKLDSTKAVYKYNQKNFKEGKIGGITFINFVPQNAEILGHGGLIHAYRSGFFWRNKSNRGIIWTLNTRGFNGDKVAIFTGILDSMQDRLLGLDIVHKSDWKYYENLFGKKKK